VTVRVAPNLVAELPGYFGDAAREQIAQAGPPDAAGWLTVQLAFESLEAARARLLGFGGAVEALEPYALRRSILDYAEQIAALYSITPRHLRRSRESLAASLRAVRAKQSPAHGGSLRRKRRSSQ
jgi:hypothetical protein